MADVPKHNVQRDMSDIRRFSDKDALREEGKTIGEIENQEEQVVELINEAAAGAPTLEQDLAARTEAARRAHERRRAHTRMLAKYSTAFAGLCVLVISGVLFIRLNTVQGEVSHSLASGFTELQEGLSALRSFNPGAAEQSFKYLQGLPQASGIDMVFSQAIPTLKEGGEIIRNFQSLAAKALTLAGEIQFLQKNIPQVLFDGRGQELIRRLNAVERLLGEVNEASTRFSSSASKLQPTTLSAGSGQLPVQIDLERFRDVLRVVGVWLSSETPRRVAIFIQNPAELRPGGGFIGSYLELTIAQGNITAMQARDINEPDRLLDVTVVPPKPLQLITKRWRAADANWFFDFPASAERTLAFLDASKLYADAGAPFDVAIGLSAETIEDVLEILGGIELPDRKLTLTADNALIEIQKAVQNERAASSATPKNIIADVAQVLRDRLMALTDDQRALLAEDVARWTQTKRLTVYARDTLLQELSRKYGLAGDVYALPGDWNGEYLAVAAANIGGAKTDLYMQQSLTLETQLSEQGTANSRLTIVRTHTGNTASSWWYKEPNQSYLQVFTPPGSRLERLTGAIEKKISAPLNYTKEKYATDQLVQDIESSRTEFVGIPLATGYTQFGKNVFAAWSRVLAGKSQTISFEYSRKLPLAPADGVPYQFVFERQSGVQGEYRFLVSAPVGFRFKENNLPVYEYVSGDPPARLVVDLTLVKDPQAALPNSSL